MDYTSGGAPVAGFIFPVLKPAEIQQCMLELGTELSLEELQDPAHHKEKLRKVFTFLLEVCAGKTEDDFAPTPEMLNKAAEMAYPELHQEFNELQFYTCLCDLLTCAGYATFSFRDLHVPTAKRLRYQLSAIINLAKFREEQLKVYQELNEPRMRLIKTLEDVNQENAQLQELEQKVNRESKAQFKAMEEVIRECEELEIEIARNNKLQAAAREEAAALKKTANDLKDQVATAVWALQEAEAEEEKLRLQVVTSPDRRKSEMLVRKDRLLKVKQECADLETAIQECKTKVVNAMQALQDLDTTNGVLDDLLEEANKHTELMRKIEEMRKRCQAKNKITAEVHKQIEEATRQLARLEEKIVHQRKQHKLQMDAAHEALEQAKEQLLRVEKERREGMARVEAGEAEVQAIEAEIDQERAKTEAEIQTIAAEYKIVETAFLERNRMRMDALKKRAP